MLVSSDQRLGEQAAEVGGRGDCSRLALKTFAARRQCVPSEASLLCEKALLGAYMTRRAYMTLYTRVYEAANYNAMQMQRKTRLAQAINVWISQTFELRMLSELPPAWREVYAVLGQSERRALMCTCTSFASSYRNSRVMQQKAKRLYLPMLKYLDKVI